MKYKINLVEKGTGSKERRPVYWNGDPDFDDSTNKEIIYDGDVIELEEIKINKEKQNETR